MSITTMPGLERWIGLTEASHTLRVSVVRVRQWADEGRIEALLTPLGRVVSRESVAKLAAERAARPTGYTAA